MQYFKVDTDLEINNMTSNKCRMPTNMDRCHGMSNVFSQELHSLETNDNRCTTLLSNFPKNQYSKQVKDGRSDPFLIAQLPAKLLHRTMELDMHIVKFRLLTPCPVKKNERVAVNNGTQAVFSSVYSPLFSSESC